MNKPKFGIRYDLIDLPGEAAILKLEDDQVKIFNNGKWDAKICSLVPKEFLEMSLKDLEAHVQPLLEEYDDIDDTKESLNAVRKEMFYYDLLYDE